MNRANFGNIATNGIQTLSVSGFTGSSAIIQNRRAKIADASSALNNLVDTDGMSPKEAFNAKLGAAKEIGMARADELKADISRQEAGGKSPFQHLSDEEAGQYQKAVADDMRKKFQGENEDVDDIMADTPMAKIGSPQNKNLSEKINNDFNAIKIWTRKGSAFSPTTIGDLAKEYSKGGNK